VPNNPAPLRHIEIPGDTLIPDGEFRALLLNNCTRRTASRLEDEGLPYVFIAGFKFRPLREGREWLAARIQRRAGTSAIHSSNTNENELGAADPAGRQGPAADSCPSARDDDDNGRNNTNRGRAQR
jgi:hypothetical protein